MKAEILRKELGIFTQGDLLHHFPFRYVDRTKFYTVKEANANLPYIQIKGTITSLIVRGEKRRKYLAGRFEDKTGFLELRWFQGIKWITANLKLNTEYVLLENQQNLMERSILFIRSWNLVQKRNKPFLPLCNRFTALLKN